MLNKTIAVLLAKMYNEMEFWYPLFRLREAGVEVVVVAEEAEKKYMGKEGMAARSDRAFSQVTADDFDGVVIPGGQASESLRQSQACLNLVKEMNDQNKMIAFICYAGWVPISCGIVKGRRCTSVRAIREDMVNAGCVWADRPLVVDGNFVTSRDPDDLPDFLAGILDFLTGARQGSAAGTIRG